MSVKPFGLEPEDFALCKEAAVEAIKNYGVETGAEFDRVTNPATLHNDHVAVQAAVELWKILNRAEP